MTSLKLLAKNPREEEQCGPKTSDFHTALNIKQVLRQRAYYAESIGTACFFGTVRVHKSQNLGFKATICAGTPDSAFTSAAQANSS